MLEMRYTENDIAPFEEKVLASGLCDIMLPMFFTGVNEGRRAVYDNSGYRCMDDMAGEIEWKLEILEKTLANLEKAGEFLIDPGKILLNGKTVFQDPRCRDVRIAYVPCGSGDAMKNVMLLMDHMVASSGDDDKEAICEIEDYIKENNLSVDSARRYVGMVRRKGIIDKQRQV